ncbi:MAG TPA: cytochrome c oxidase assembly protein, partial [Longimicrobium sp.]|nr:cytochrome c oxidase assembly protein [Longimicrobium sp.]
MSRTRLFGEVQRAYLLARESLRTGETAAEVVDRAREEGALSRRRFLGFTAAGVAALALALSPPLDAWADARLSGHMVQHAL